LLLTANRSYPTSSPRIYCCAGLIKVTVVLLFGDMVIAEAESFRKWLKGSFVCRKCNREFYTMCFGFGGAICPDCYDGEQPFLFFDPSYWLNRVTSRLINQSKLYERRQLEKLERSGIPPSSKPEPYTMKLSL